MAEVSVALEAIHEAVKGKWMKIIFEGDCLLALQPLQNWNILPDWCIVSFIDEAKSILCSSFFMWSVSKVLRSCNGLAHNLAQWAANFCCVGDINLTSIPASVLKEGIYLYIYLSLCRLILKP